MSNDNKHRSHLPIPSPDRTGLITYDAKDPDTKFPPIEQLRPPNGAPNVLLILIDDAGFGSNSAFGGPCQTPNLEKLAAAGLKYNRFHTTALCSPTRAALLTGRNHHSAGMGGITEIATGAPGYSSVLPNTISPLARTLKLNGYSTAQFGKCHEVPVWETSPVGPFDAWPTGGGGFEYFYGFVGGEANQWYPTLYEGTTPVEPKKTPEEGYHFMADMTDKAVALVGQQKALAPDKPFFVYFAPGATHAPHHVPKEWADKYKGQLDQGWDKLREDILAQQKALGVVPADCRLTARHAEIPAWDEMPEALKPILRRQMEVYAGFLEYTDHHIGRLIDGLKKLNILDDTLIFYITGDNGASAEGTINGAYNAWCKRQLGQAQQYGKEREHPDKTRSTAPLAEESAARPPKAGPAGCGLGQRGGAFAEERAGLAAGSHFRRDPAPPSRTQRRDPPHPGAAHPQLAGDPRGRARRHLPARPSAGSARIV